MTDKHRLNREKISQAKAFLAESGIDCWIIKTKEGSDPCMPLMFGLSIVGDAILFVTPGKVFALTSTIDAQDVRESGLFDTVYTYGPGEMGKTLLALVQELDPKRIAINYSRENMLADGLTVGSYRALMNMLTPEYASRVESSEPFLQRLRSIKSAQEIEYVRKAIEITLDIYDEVFAKVKKGMTEIEIGDLFVQGMAKRDVVNGITRKLTPPIVMTCNISHRGPSEVVLKEGDYLIFDFSVDYMGYCSDIARTCYVLKEGETEASESMQRAFETVYEAVNRAIATLKPGAIGKDVDLAARQHVLDCGYKDIFHAVGHQVGRNVHDGGTLLGPLKKSYKNASLGTVEEGMVFAIEPTILYEEGPAIISEDNVLVTAEGAVLLSKRQEALVLIH
jgi:Xaa-Pro aminopeptidase